MADPKSRNWSTKTLARELLRFLDTIPISATSTVDDLLEALKSQIVEDEVGVAWDTWKEV